MASQTPVATQTSVAKQTPVATQKDNDMSVKKKRFIIVKRAKDKISEHEEEEETTTTDKVSANKVLPKLAEMPKNTVTEMPKNTLAEMPKNTLAEYISQLSEQEQIVMKIASEHLKTSFDLEKSSGYLQYLRRSRPISTE